MHQTQAIEMLSVTGGFPSAGQRWVDFGCGSGTFTLALAHLLGTGSAIVAVDKDGHSLHTFPDQFKTISIEKITADFTKIDFPPNSLNGILMANSLHYVQYQKEFIRKASKYLKSGGCFLIVEYNTNRSNPWIPYPIRFDRLEQLFKKEGFSSIEKINEKPSKYNTSNLYSAIIRQTQPSS